MKKITNLTLAGLLLSRQKLGNEEDIGISKWNIEHKNTGFWLPEWMWPCFKMDRQLMITCVLWDIESLELDRRPLGPLALVAFYLIRGTLYPTVHTQSTAKICIERFHLTSRRPSWCSKTMKWRPSWCPKWILWDL